MASFLLSTLAFFVSSWFLRRYLDDLGIPKGFTRAAVIFMAALLVSYGVAFLVDFAVNIFASS